MNQRMLRLCLTASFAVGAFITTSHDASAQQCNGVNEPCTGYGGSGYAIWGQSSTGNGVQGTTAGGLAPVAAEIGGFFSSGAGDGAYADASGTGDGAGYGLYAHSVASDGVHSLSDGTSTSGVAGIHTAGGIRGQLISDAIPAG
jgi:hypothetical protein